MTMLVAIVICAVTYGAFRLWEDYIRRSMRSFSNAERVFVDIEAKAHEILDQPIPQSVARFVVGLVGAAGCGCFVRGLLMSHYLPKVTIREPDPNSPVTVAMNDIDEMDASVRSLVWHLMAMVVVYDSFRNPLQGWLFRRTMKSFISAPSQINVGARLETWHTALSVLGRKATAA